MQCNIFRYIDSIISLFLLRFAPFAFSIFVFIFYNIISVFCILHLKIAEKAKQSSFIRTLNVSAYMRFRTLSKVAE